MDSTIDLCDFPFYRRDSVVSELILIYLRKIDEFYCMPSEYFVHVFTVVFYSHRSKTFNQCTYTILIGIKLFMRHLKKIFHSRIIIYYHITIVSYRFITYYNISMWTCFFKPNQQLFIYS